MEINELQTSQNEMLVVGSMYKNPDLYVEYGRSIKSEYDFNDEATRFLYDCFELMYKTFSQKVDENKLNTFMSQDKDRLKKYRKLGGWKLIVQWMELANIDDFKNYLEAVKKYSLLREYDRRGYGVDKIMAHPRFNTLKANDIYRIVRSGADKISTKILADDSVVVMNKDNVKFIQSCVIKPKVGLQMPFPILNDMFRGLRLGKLFALGFLSNEGKTRLATFLACYIAFVKGEKVYMMCNETSEEDIRACLLTTVINNDCFKEAHGIDIGKNERDIVMGIYTTDSGEIIERRYDDIADKWEETEEEFLERLYNSSQAYRNVIAVGEWLDAQENELMFFERLKDYSDGYLEFKIRQMSLSKNIKYFIYDTLKGYKDENWAIIKQTTTLLSELAGELNVCIWADIQLTDDSVYTDIFSFSSNNIANAKQLKHILDYLMLGKRLHKTEYSQYKYISMDSNWGEPNECDLDINKTYYALKVDKNRGGDKDKIPVMMVDLNKNTWEEVGILIKAIKKKKE